MVIHEENEEPAEISIIKSGHLESNSYATVKNHVGVLENKVATVNSTREKSLGTQREQKRSRKKGKKQKPQNESISEVSGNNQDSTEIGISKNDLEELKIIYNQCKAVLNKIEAKYGHLLNLEDAGPSVAYEEDNGLNNEKTCNCKLNKKIIFDDDGKQETQESVLANHVCCKRIKRRHSAIKLDSNNIEIEYDEQNTLPKDLPSLANILRDADIDITYRNKVIDKIKSIKQEHANQIRFDKPSLIEKLKSNQEGILGFEGTNLSSLPGYPDWK